LTAHDVHYVLSPHDGSTLTPAASTEFANDKAFGYENSYLPAWVEEKTAGRVKSEDVVSLGLDLIRQGGPDAVAKVMAQLAPGAVIVANSLTTHDMAVVSLGCLRAESTGDLKHCIYRTAGSFVASTAGIGPRAPLSSSELARSQPVVPDTTQQLASSEGGLVVVGSYVGKSSEQLAILQQQCPWMQSVELDVAKLLDSWEGEESRVRQAVECILRDNSSAVVYTSRVVVQEDGAGGLDIGQQVTSALVSVVANLQTQPKFIVAKGGITSNDIAVEALQVKKAHVLGQVVPGVPVWRCGPESKAPGLAYVVFPGNVGAPDDLARVAGKMSGRVDSAEPPRIFIPDMLREARSMGRAVGAFNVYNLEGVLAVKHAAEALGAPAILQLHHASMEFGGTALLKLCQAVARDSTVPMAVQLDHAQQDAYIQAAIACGVDGVMADGSHLPFEENLTWTRSIQRLASQKGIPIEAELGKLAGEEDGMSVPEVEARMTDPSVAAHFIESTGAHSLAVTIGNVHGRYARPPTLDFDRLNRIRDAVGTDLPLVLHGASGLPDSMIERAMQAGVCKFNVNTELRMAARDAAKGSAGKDVLDVMKGSVDAMEPVVKAKLRLFGW
jgi:ketose-bisphosphate aldolase